MACTGCTSWTAAFFAAALVTLAYVAHLVAEHTIDVVDARGRLPRWDLATHLVLGWNDRGPTIVRLLDQFLPKGSTLTVAATRLDTLDSAAFAELESLSL